MNTYKLYVHFSGNLTVDVEADTEQEALAAFENDPGAYLDDRDLGDSAEFDVVSME